MTRTRSAILLAAATLLSGCAGGGSDGGEPIVDELDLVPELVFVRSQIDRRGSGTEIRTATGRGLADERPLVDRPGIESGVRVNPAGTRVVFTRERTPGDAMSREIYVADLDRATSEERITADREIDDDPCWNGDGTRILFSSTRGDTGRRIWSVDPDSPTGSFETLFDDGGEQRDPDARGDLVVFSRIDATRNRSEIWLLNTQTSLAVPITNGGTTLPFEGDSAAGDYEPALTPDLTHVVFTRSIDQQRRALMQVNLATFEATELGGVPTDPIDNRRPRVAPDGSILVARRVPTDAEGGTLRLYHLDSGGGDPVAVFADKRFDFLGFDTLPGYVARPTLLDSREADLFDATIERAFGLGSVGAVGALQKDDGMTLGLFTALASGRQVCGLRVRVRLPGIADPTTIQRIEFEARAAVSRVDGDAILRLAVEDLIDNRNDTVVEIAPDSAELQSIQFTMRNLTYVSRDGQISFTLIADLPDGDTAELSVDRITVRVLEAATPGPTITGG